MKAIVMTISLMVLGSCAHNHGDKHKHGEETASQCRADMSCCKDGACDIKKKKS